MPDKILGLDIKKDTIRAVMIKSGFKSNQLISHVQIPIEQTEENNGWETAIQSLKEQMDISGATIISSFPSENMFFRNISVPFKDQKKIRQILPFELEPSLICPIDDLIFDFHIVEKGEMTKLIVAATKIDDMQLYWDRLTEVKMEPEIVTVEGFALPFCILEIPGTPENFICITIEPEKIIIAFVVSKQIHLIRCVEIPTHHTFNMFVNEFVMQSLMLFQEMSYSTYFFETVFLTGTCFSEDIQNELSKSLELPVFPISLTQMPRLKLDKQQEQDMNPHEINEALALTLHQHSSQKLIDLRQGPFEIHSQWIEYKSEIVNTAFGLCMLGLAAGGNFFIDTYYLQKKEADLTQQVRVIFQKALPGVTIKDPLLQIREEIESLKQSFMVPGEKVSQLQVIDLLKSISDQIPNNIDVQFTRFSSELDDILISGDTDTFNSVDEIKNNLEAVNEFKKVIVSSSKKDRSGRIQFKLKVELNEQKKDNQE